MYTLCRVWKVINNQKIQPHIRKYSSKKYHTIFQKEFVVTPFCTLDIIGNCHLNIVPLDVHKYMNSDQIFIKFVAPVEKEYEPSYKLDNDILSINTTTGDHNDDLICNIEAPVKANVKANLDFGNIHLSNFQGDNIHLKTAGDIEIENCHCQKIDLNSEEGNIICKKVLQASEIYLKTSNFGNITTNKLQGITLMASTVNGNIRTQSTYFNDSFFKTETGSIYLANAHRKCNIVINKTGNLDLVRFDGTLDAILNEGTANIQLSRIEGNSSILIENLGELNLKLFETCQQNISMKIFGKDIRLNENVQMVPSKEKNALILTGGNSKGHGINVNAAHSVVNIEGATIADLFSKSM